MSHMKAFHRNTKVERRQSKTDHVLQNCQPNCNNIINSTNTIRFQNMTKMHVLVQVNFSIKKTSFSFCIRPQTF